MKSWFWPPDSKAADTRGDYFRFGFFRFDSVFFVWLNFFSLARFFFRFGLVFFGLGSFRFGFFSFRLIKPKPNRTGQFFQNSNRFFSRFGFSVIFFPDFLSFLVFLLTPS